MILWRNIENYPFLSFLIPTPDFPHFYYMLGGKSGVAFVRKCFRDAHLQKLYRPKSADNSSPKMICPVFGFAFYNLQLKNSFKSSLISVHISRVITLMIQSIKIQIPFNME